jgi:hypothetical protein
MFIVLEHVQVEAAVKTAAQSAGPVDLLAACAGIYRGKGMR